MHLYFIWNGCTNDVIHYALVARKFLLSGDNSPACCIWRRMSQQLSIFYAGEFCHSDSLHLLLLVTAWYYLRPRMYMRSEKQAIVTKIKRDPNITRRMWNHWTWNTNVWCSQPLIVQLHRRECFLGNCKSLGIFLFSYVPHTMVTLITKIPTTHHVSPLTTILSPIKALFHYNPTMYTFFSQKASFGRLPEYFI